MTKKFIQDIVVNPRKGLPRKPEVKVVSQPEIKQENGPYIKSNIKLEIKPEPQASVTPKVEVFEKPPVTVKPTDLTTRPEDKISQNPFFKERAALAEKENYLPPEWSDKRSGTPFKKLFKWILVLFITGSVFFIGIKIVSVFSTVNIKVMPKQKIIEIKKDLSLTGQEELEYMTFLDSRTKIIPGTGQQEMEQRATGVVAIFNNNAKTQFLVKETRLESPDGKIYKTEKSLTIPANGSIEVNVFADKPGKEYNIELADFKLPGFKGNPKYETVFGRSKTTMIGGYVGMASTLSDEEFNKAKEELREGLSIDLKNFIEKNVRADFLVYPNSIVVEFATSTENPKVGDINENFEIKETATVTAYSIKKDALTQKIVGAYIAQLTPASPKGFTIANLDKLKFSLKKASEDGGAMEFTIEGPTTFVWGADKESLINEMRNTSSANYKSLLSKHSEIENAEIIFNPSWWKLMPKDESRIKYEEVRPI